MSSNRVEQAIVQAVQKVAPGVRALDAQTELTGSAAVLDSVGFVTFLVTLEAELAHRVDISEMFLQNGNAGDDSPFRTIGRLARHLAERLGEAAS